MGFISGFLSGNNSSTQYLSINRPEISPPPSVFPIVWTILYILMGIASYLVYISDSPHKEKALVIYFAQLIINFFWSIIFFGFNNYLFAFIWLILLIVMICYTIYLFYKVNKVAAYLLIPYLLWCLFAAYLNYMIVIMN